MTTTLLMLAAVVLAMSAATFITMALDKSSAARGRPRVPEKTLHTLELLGGWPGSLLAMRLLRHKTRKPAYYLVTWAIAALHTAAVIAYQWSRGG